MNSRISQIAALSKRTITALDQAGYVTVAAVSDHYPVKDKLLEDFSNIAGLTEHRIVADLSAIWAEVELWRLREVEKEVAVENGEPVPKEEVLDLTDEQTEARLWQLVMSIKRPGQSMTVVLGEARRALLEYQRLTGK